MTFNAFLHETTAYTARQLCASLNPVDKEIVSADECYAFGDIMEFLWANPEYVTQKRGRKTRPNILVEEGVREVAERWVEGRRQIVTLSSPKTISDPAVEAILAQRGVHVYKAAAFHRIAMGAENVIGTLLEKYIATEMEHYGWTWVAGEIVRSVDFLKRTDDGFIPLQIKNRSNSENSSSAAIRNGTDIIKWHRIDARTGKTFWDKFPEPDLRTVLTEEGFHTYIKENLK